MCRRCPVLGEGVRAAAAPALVRGEVTVFCVRKRRLREAEEHPQSHTARGRRACTQTWSPTARPTLPPWRLRPTPSTSGTCPLAPRESQDFLPPPSSWGPCRAGSGGPRTRGLLAGLTKPTVLGWGELSGPPRLRTGTGQGVAGGEGEGAKGRPRSPFLGPGAGEVREVEGPRGLRVSVTLRAGPPGDAVKAAAGRTVSQASAASSDEPAGSVGSPRRGSTHPPPAASDGR